MKQKILLTLILLLSSISGYSQLRVVNDRIYTGGDASVTPSWPKLDADGNRNPKQALVIIRYDGFPEKEVGRTTTVTEINNPNGVESITTPDGTPLTLMYISLDEKALVFKHPVFGPARVSLPKLKNRGIYNLTLQVDKRMDIDIEPLTDYESVKVYLDQNQGKDSPARFNNVSLGTHSVMFELPDGHRLTRQIEVTPRSDKFNEVTNPDFDMRRLMRLNVESTDRNVKIYIDDKHVADKAPYIAELPAGAHTVKAESSLNSRKFDITTANIELGANMMTVKLNPRERRKFKVTGSFGNSYAVPMMLYAGKEEAYKISQDHAKGEQKSYEFDLPVGSKYKFKATYQGNEGKRTIKVTPDMAHDQVIRIKRRHKFVWPWEREYDAPPVGITAGYIRKRYEVKADGETFYRGTLTNWDIADGDNGNWLHGIKVGVQYQPTFSFGLGLYTGLFWEHFRSTTDRYDTDDDGLTTSFCKYQEHSLSLPAQVFYNFPFAGRIALAFHGGLNFNYMLSRSYSGYVVQYDGIKYEHSYNALKDKDQLFPCYPDAFQMLWEVGVQLRLGPIMLGAQMSRPITTHKFEMDGEQFTTSTIKNSLTITYVF